LLATSRGPGIREEEVIDAHRLRDALSYWCISPQGKKETILWLQLEQGSLRTCLFGAELKDSLRTHVLATRQPGFDKAMYGVLTQGQGMNNLVSADLALTDRTLYQEKLKTHPMTILLGYPELEWHLYVNAITGQMIGASVRGTEEISMAGGFLPFVQDCMAGKELLAIGHAQGPHVDAASKEAITELPRSGQLIIQNARDAQAGSEECPAIAIIAEFRRGLIVAQHISLADKVLAFDIACFQTLICTLQNLHTRTLVIIKNGASVHFANLSADTIIRLTTPPAEGANGGHNPG
jgi:hypothetical protein